MNSIRTAIDNPVTVAVGVILILLFGLIGLSSMPYQLTPSVTEPEISVSTIWPGATPYEIERDIIEEQEKVLKGLPGLVSMESSSENSRGSITLTFTLDTEVDDALLRVSNKMNEVPAYPATADRPVISASGASASPVIWMLLKNKEADQGSEEAQQVSVETQRTYFENEVRQYLERVPGVSELFIGGGTKQEMHIVIDPVRLAAHKLTIAHLLATLSTENVTVSAGSMHLGRREYRIRSIADFKSPEDIEAIVLTSTGQERVTLADVGYARFDYEPRNASILHNAVPGIVIGVRPEPNANILDMTDRVFAVVEELNAGPLAERGLYIHWASEQRPYIKGAISLVRNNIIIGGTLAVVVLLTFLGSVSATLIVAVAIPVSVIGSFFFMAALGRNLNVVSLAGISFAVGMLVDNAIVVLENIDRHRRMGKPAWQAAYDGAHEVWGAVLASTLTTIAVFLPIIFLEEEAGQLFKDIAIAVSCAVSLSLFVSMSVIPVLGKIFFSLAEKRKNHSLSLSATAGKAGQEIRALVSDLAEMFHDIWDWLCSTRAVHFVSTLPVLEKIFTTLAEKRKQRALLRLARHSSVTQSPFARLRQSLRAFGSSRFADLYSRVKQLTDRLQVFWKNVRDRFTLQATALRQRLNIFGKDLAEKIMGLVDKAIATRKTRLATIISLTLFALLSTWALFPKMEYLPQGNRNLLFNLLIPPPGLSVHEFDAIGTSLFEQAEPFLGKDEVGELPGIDNMFYVGTPSFAAFGIIASHEQRARELIPMAQQMANSMPGVFGVSFQAGIFQESLGGGRSIDVDISGDKLQTLTGAGGMLYGAISQAIAGAQIRPIPSLELTFPEVQFVPYRDRLRAAGFTAQDLGISLDVLMDGRKIGDFKEEGKKKIDLRVKADDAFSTTPEALYESLLSTPEGKLVPLSSLARLERTAGITSIRHLERRRTITLQITPPETLPLEQAMDILSQQVLPATQKTGALAGTTVSLSGAADKLTVTRQALQWNFVLALVIVYLLMSALFGNFIYPFVILFTVPLAAAGGFWGLALQNLVLNAQPLDILTMLGFVILVGIVVNNAILIVHQSLTNIREKHLEPTAAVREAVRTRLRPIYMSTITSVFGMLPLAVAPGPGSELYRGLGSVILGGLAMSSLFTVFMIPALLLFFIGMETTKGETI